jgi:hypothetical protein
MRPGPGASTPRKILIAERRGFIFVRGQRSGVNFLPDNSKERLPGYYPDQGPVYLTSTPEMRADFDAASPTSADSLSSSLGFLVGDRDPPVRRSPRRFPALPIMNHASGGCPSPQLHVARGDIVRRAYCSGDGGNDPLCQAVGTRQQRQCKTTVGAQESDPRPE